MTPTNGDTNLFSKFEKHSFWRSITGETALSILIMEYYLEEWPDL
ncbi:hypothetical protein [Candidatus Williamhamiltonella defendens]|nr:hypothetical protein [Candidatus Hamiltonella defensa]